MTVWRRASCVRRRSAWSGGRPSRHRTAAIRPVGTGAMLTSRFTVEATLTRWSSAVAQECPMLYGSPRCRDERMDCSVSDEGCCGSPSPPFRVDGVTPLVDEYVFVGRIRNCAGRFMRLPGYHARTVLRSLGPGRSRIGHSGGRQRRSSSEAGRQYDARQIAVSGAGLRKQRQNRSLCLGQYSCVVSE